MRVGELFQKLPLIKQNKVFYKYRHYLWFMML
jgi:hypothetical protein